ncbi:hypothetical protein CWO91_10350 [Bradyrhizobium genosp. SA-3]|nr:hypothetical protein CWO91_10350 [Bradyrhizobium genosp. SA-3]
MLPAQVAGSRQPFGPPILDRKRSPIHNVEAPNDRNMIVIAGALGGLGAAYGIATSSGPWMAALFAIAYGTVGILVGVPFAGFLNLTRRLWQ